MEIAVCTSHPENKFSKLEEDTSQNEANEGKEFCLALKDAVLLRVAICGSAWVEIELNYY